MTQQAIADELGVSDRTVRSDLKAEEKSVMTQKPSAPRKVTQYKISEYTKPETAAQMLAYSKTLC
jgi:transcriptional antiterminator